MDKLVTVVEAANILGLNPQTIYRHYQEGKLPAYRFGKALRFDMKELKEFMRESANSSGKPSDRIQIQEGSE